MRLIAYSLALLIALPAGAAEISGVAGDVRITDGDTIIIGKEEIRLHGIDAPEKRQMCDDGRTCIPCGQMSQSALLFAIGVVSNADRVTCKYTQRDRYKRIIGKCFAGNLDLSDWMVRSGHAVAYRKYSTDYVAAEEEARRAKHWLWQWKFVTPEKWRSGERLACEG